MTVSHLNPDAILDNSITLDKLTDEVKDFISDKISISPQTLTDSEKEQARENIEARKDDVKIELSDASDGVHFAPADSQIIISVYASTKVQEIYLIVGDSDGWDPANTKVARIAGDANNPLVSFYYAPAFAQGGKFLIQSNINDEVIELRFIGLRPLPVLSQYTGELPPESEEIEPENIGGGSSDPTGVISQMQTWSEVTPGGAYTYALSDIVQGAIPISFIDLVRVADNANFNTSTGYFEINDLTDVSYEEMMVIHDVNEVAKVMCTLGGQQLRQFFEHKEPRTITICNNGVNSINYNYSFRRFGTTNTKTETIAIGSDMADILWSTGFSEAFYRCQYLRKIGIYGSLKPTSSSTSFSLAFTQCRSLTDLRITGLASSISLADSYYAAPISMASLAYIINNAGTATITITVGSAIYTAAQSDADVQAALQSKTNVSLASA